MSEKPNTEQQATALVERLLDASSPAQARRALADLLTARLRDIVIGEHAYETVQRGTGEQVLKWQRLIVERMKDRVGLESLGVRSFTMELPAQLRVTRKGDIHIEVDGSIEEMLAVQATILLHRIGSRLRMCDCGEVFVRKGKRLFCSARCQMRVYMKERRAQERAEAEAFTRKKGYQHGKKTRTR